MSDEAVLIALLKTRIKAARSRAGLSQEDVAEALGFTAVYYQRFEGLRQKRTFNPTVLTLFRLSHVIGVTLDELMKPATPEELSALDASFQPLKPKRTEKR